MAADTICVADLGVSFITRYVAVWVLEQESSTTFSAVDDVEHLDNTSLTGSSAQVMAKSNAEQ